MKKNKVIYGGNTYEQAGLDFEDLLFFGASLQPKLAGIGATFMAVFTENTVVNNEIYSFYKTMNELFSPEEMKNIYKLFLLNERNLLIIDGVALNTNDIEEHFRGDLLRAFKVAWGLAMQNLGELNVFIESLPPSMKTFINFLKEMMTKDKAEMEKLYKEKIKR